MTPLDTSFYHIHVFTPISSGYHHWINFSYPTLCISTQCKVKRSTNQERTSKAAVMSAKTNLNYSSLNKTKQE